MLDKNIYLRTRCPTSPARNRMRQSHPRLTEVSDVTVLFADLRDFTAQSQQMSPEEVVRSRKATTRGRAAD